MKLIDADEVSKTFEKMIDVAKEHDNSFDYIVGLCAGMAAVKIANVVEVETVKHGHWIFDKTIQGKCSVCGCMCGYYDYDGADNYCSNCGSKMDEKEGGKP